VDGPRPYPVYLFINVAFGLAFMLYATIASVYRIQTVGLNPLQLVLVGTALELAVLIFEVPTGVFADTYGRRRSVIVGFFLIGAGFSFEGALPTFGTVLAAQAVWGVGYTFVSGALQAWIADELEGRDLGRVYLRGEQMDYLGSFIGVSASALLATVALNLPLLLAGALAAALGAALIFFMREPNFRPTPREARTSLAQMGATARGGARLVRARPVLLTLLAVSAFSGMSSEGFDRLWEAHLLQDIGLPRLGGLDPVVWFGVINAGTLVLGYLAAEVIGRRLDVGSVTVASRALFVLDALTIAGVLAFALAGSFAFALGAFWLAGLARRLGEPMYLAWLNQGLEPGVRATVISISSQSDALGQVAGGPAVGAVGTLAGIRAALTVAALTLSPALLLYARAIRRGGVEFSLESSDDPRKSNSRY
jgi:DHA3 family tetracycline resistance protein-like MFS transporter